MPDALFDAATRPYDTDRWRRIVGAEQTVARLKPLMPVFGITRVANVTGLDTIGIPTVMVLRPNSRALAVSQGKGTSLAAAKASGLMESIESYHAERITLPLKLGSYEDLHPASSPTSCRFSGSRAEAWRPEPVFGCPLRWCTPTTHCRYLPGMAISRRPATGFRRATMWSRRPSMACAN